MEADGWRLPLNRPIQSLVEQTGSSREPLEAGYMQGPRPMAFPSSGHRKAADLIISSAEAGDGCQNQMLKVGQSRKTKRRNFVSWLLS